MTREEAVEMLKAEMRFQGQYINALRMMNYDDDATQRPMLTIQALDLAIEALKAEIIVRGETIIIPVGCKKQETCLDWEPLQGEKEELVKRQLSGETSTNEGDAESATTTDCISRADIEYHTQLEARGNGQYEEVEVAYKSDIDNLPQVTPTERTGEWVATSNGGMTFWYACSECHHAGNMKDKFCRNCGCKMGGDTE